MELDKRIMSGKKPLTCFDVEQAKEFLGKECYFSNCKCHYKNLSAFEKFVSLTDHCIGELTAVMDLGDRVFDVDQQCNEFRYCLPCEWVKPKEPEKKYRAFTIKEFQQKYSVGSVFQIRQKQNRFTESVVQYTGYKVYEERIYLGITDFTLDELFENFEMIEPQNDTWQPFGVMEDD